MEGDNSGIGKSRRNPESERQHYQKQRIFNKVKFQEYVYKKKKKKDALLVIAIIVEDTI